MKTLLLLFLSSTLTFSALAQDQTTSDQVKEWVVEHSKKGGTIDFFSSIKGIENDVIQTAEGDFNTNLGLALYNWGMAVKEAGVVSLDDALALYQQIKGADLSENEVKNITKGFN